MASFLLVTQRSCVSQKLFLFRAELSDVAQPRVYCTNSPPPSVGVKIASTWTRKWLRWLFFFFLKKKDQKKFFSKIVHLFSQKSYSARRNNVLFFSTFFNDSVNQHVVFFDKDLFFAWRHLWLTLNLKLWLVPRLKIVPAFWRSL